MRNEGGAPRILTRQFPFLSSQCDRYGSWLPSDLLTCMQEMAGSHSAVLGMDRDHMLAMGVIWVLLRNEYHLHSSPKVGEMVTATSYPLQPRRTLYPRYHEFHGEDGRLLAKGMGGWTLADVETHRMVALPAVHEKVPDTSDLEPAMGYPQAAQQLEGPAEVALRPLSYTDIDLNQHVNNTRCGDWVLDMLGDERVKGHFVSHFIANYDREILPGGPVTLSLRTDGLSFSLRCERDDTRLIDCAGSLSPI